MSKTFEDFLAALAKKESSGRYNIENYSGYLGKYQMGEYALIDAGYYLRDGTGAKRNAEGKYVDNDWIGNWTGRMGVNSKWAFLSKADAQEDAIRRHVVNLWKQIKALHLDSYEGSIINGNVITKSGMIGGAHLKGVGGLRVYLKSAGRNNPADGNNTSIECYVSKFGGYDVDGFLKGACGATNKAGNQRVMTIDGQSSKSKRKEQRLGCGTNSQYYVVRSGDTLSRISRINKLPIGEILAANPSISDINRIYSGQKLNLPTRKGSASSHTTHQTPSTTARKPRIADSPKQSWSLDTLRGWVKRYF